MNRLGAVVLMLLTLTWGTPSGAAAAKVEHFKDNQGTVHITNVQPDDQAAPGAAPGAPAPAQSGAAPPAAGLTPPPPPIAGPDEAPVLGPPPTETSPETETQPDNR